jgi:hypothetical protein
MAVVPSQRDSPRGKAAAARPPTEQYPKTVIELFYTVVDDDKRTSNSLQVLDRLTTMLVIVIITGCAVAYAVAAATKGFHVEDLTLPELIPGGVVGGGTLTYIVRRVLLWFRGRRGAAAKPGTQTTEISLDVSHTPAPQEGTSSQ